jgi:hypothetical protein
LDTTASIRSPSFGSSSSRYVFHGVGFDHPVEAIWKPSISMTRPSASSICFAPATISSTSN